MKTLLAPVLIVSFMTSGNAFAAFYGCEDAYNYGYSSAELYVAQVFASIECNADRVDFAEKALAKVTKGQVLETTDSDAEKACFFEGFYTALLQRTSQEYDECDGSRFSCMDLSGVARYAAADFVALYKSVADVGSLSVSLVTVLYSTDKLYGYPTPICTGDSAWRCMSLIEDYIEDALGGGVSGDLVDAIGDVVCQ